MNHSRFLHRVPASIAVFVCSVMVAKADGPFQATGFKVGEVTESTAIVWTRLTESAERNPESAPMVEFQFARNAEGRPTQRVTGILLPENGVAGIRNAAPGTAGEVRVGYRTGEDRVWQYTGWEAVDPDRDFTRQFPLRDLQADTDYRVQVQCRRGADAIPGQVRQGAFRTAPAADQASRVVFTVSTGQAYDDKDRPDGYQIYPIMRQLEPSFFVHTGDIVYYDRLAKNIELARYHWQRTYGLPTNVDFHMNVTSYFIKDDHDTWINDCWPTMKTDRMFEFTFEQGLGVFREQVPMGALTYRTFRWGRDLQVWMVEGRDFRSPNNMPDGPDKTIWGREQMAWFKRTVAASDATFRVLISPTPVVGPDRQNKHDNHSNVDFRREGDELRSFIAEQKNMVVVCGDRHWQYMSVHPESGVREYSCGPASDQHAGGWSQDDYREDYHRFLKVMGGFLSATVDRTDGRPTLTFRFHDVDGNINYEDVLTSDR